MDSYMQIGLIISNIVLGLAFAGTILYFKEYSKQKGENRATKEDIGKITELVESVKQQFNAQNENLKSTLQLNNSFHLSLKNEERNSIIMLNERFTRVINITSNINFQASNGELDIKAISSFHANWNAMYLDLQDPIATLRLFVTDSGVLSSTEDLVTKLGESMVEIMDDISNKYGQFQERIDLLTSNSELMLENYNLVLVIQQITKSFQSRTLPSLAHFQEQSRNFLYKEVYNGN